MLHEYIGQKLNVLNRLAVSCTAIFAFFSPNSAYSEQIEGRDITFYTCLENDKITKLDCSDISAAMKNIMSKNRKFGALGFNDYSRMRLSLNIMISVPGAEELKFKYEYKSVTLFPGCRFIRFENHNSEVLDFAELRDDISVDNSVLCLKNAVILHNHDGIADLKFLEINKIFSQLYN